MSGAGRREHLPTDRRRTGAIDDVTEDKLKDL